MFHKDQFISQNVTFRKESMFLSDIKANEKVLSREIEGKSVCVIGGAGSIGSSFRRFCLSNLSKVVVTNINEKGFTANAQDHIK